MCVDHVKVQRIKNSLLCCPMSPRAQQMLHGIMDGSLPPILASSPWDIDSDFFGEDLVAADEFMGPYQELDDRDLVGVDAVIGEDHERGGVWVTLRLAWDLPPFGKGLLS